MNLIRASKIPEGKNLDLSQITYKELKILGDDLFSICMRENLLGLSAVQVGLPLRFYIITAPDAWIGYINTEYNPIYERSIIKFKNEPFPNTRRKYKVPRWDAIEVGGYLLVYVDKPQLKTFHIEVEDIRSNLHQHLIDIINGIYPSDLGEKL